MEELKTNVDTLINEVAILSAKLGIPQKKHQLEILQAKSQQPDFWSDEIKARDVMQQIAEISAEVDTLHQLNTDTHNLHDLLELALAESEVSLEPDFRVQLSQLRAKYQEISLKLCLQGEYDKEPALLTVHAGQGGTEAMDWAEMLLRMYLRFVEHKGWQCQIINQSFGEEAGIKSATLRIQGSYAYGYLKHEAGTHRLVRLSPFNADNLRQTSFALVEVLPELPNEDAVAVNNEDLEWSFFRSSGKGGQNVNKVSTAVRLKHLPSGIVVESQAERTQERNRELARSLLSAKLWEQDQVNQDSKIKALKGSHQPATFGTGIRSYVLHPYQLVKDNRTGVEVVDTTGVLDGQLDPFIEAQLQLNLLS